MHRFLFLEIRCCLWLSLGASISDIEDLMLSAAFSDCIDFGFWSFDAVCDALWLHRFWISGI
ncbi:hypothetical protein ACQUWN_16610 [Rossellomorea aquimaris]|uniref:hypothetical protein n=1 Tax=Rossellomorea TaxID=2837508 RepID=UPI001653B593|nr:hypothetical protein [Rossellomorea vietnamensis]